MIEPIPHKRPETETLPTYEVRHIAATDALPYIVLIDKEVYGIHWDMNDPDDLRVLAESNDVRNIEQYTNILFGITDKEDNPIAASVLSFDADLIESWLGDFTNESIPADSVAELVTVAVAPEYRGNEIAGKLSEAREKIARDHGKTHIITPVHSKNIPGLVAKFKLGYYIPSQSADREGHFAMVKDLSRANGIEHDIDPDTLTEMPLNGDEWIQKIENEGYIALDLKNTYNTSSGEVLVSDTKDQDSSHWTVIIAKKK